MKWEFYKMDFMKWEFFKIEIYYKYILKFVVKNYNFSKLYIEMDINFLKHCI